MSRSAIGKRSRRKGVAWEQAVNRCLRVLWPDVYRGSQNTAGRVTDSACDNEGTPYWIESKRWKKVNVEAALAQAREKQAEKGDTRVPVVLAKSDFKEPIAVVPMFDFFDMLDELHTLRTASSWCAKHDWKKLLKGGN